MPRATDQAARWACASNSSTLSHDQNNLDVTGPRRLEWNSLGAERITQAKDVPVHGPPEGCGRGFNVREWRSLRQAEQVAVLASEAARPRRVSVNSGPPGQVRDLTSEKFGATGKYGARTMAPPP